MGFCAFCGVPVAEGSIACPKCAKAPRSARAGSAPVPLLRRLSDSLAGLLCYLPVGPVGVIVSVAFLFVEPYRRNRFVRFHAVQSILLAAFCTVLILALLAVSVLFIGVLAPLALILLFVFPLLGLAMALTTIVLMVKANAGEMFRLPFIGDLAAKQAEVV